MLNGVVLNTEQASKPAKELEAQIEVITADEIEKAALSWAARRKEAGYIAKLFLGPKYTFCVPPHIG